MSTGPGGRRSARLHATFRGPAVPASAEREWLLAGATVAVARWCRPVGRAEVETAHRDPANPRQQAKDEGAGGHQTVRLPG